MTEHPSVVSAHVTTSRGTTNERAELSVVWLWDVEREGVFNVRG